MAPRARYPALAENLQTLLEERGLTLAQLSVQADLGEPYLRGLLRGRPARDSDQYHHAIAAVLRVSVDALRGTTSAEDLVARSAPGLTPAEAEVILPAAETMLAAVERGIKPARLVDVACAIWAERTWPTDNVRWS